jgi:hypothetical protein
MDMPRKEISRAAGENCDEKWQVDAVAFAAREIRPTAREFFTITPEESGYMAALAQ